jgi:hypothetical protein
MPWNRHGIDRVDRVDRERVCLDLGLLHIQSVAETGWDIRHLGIVTIISTMTSLTGERTFEKILSLMASAVFMPVISTSVNCSLSVVTCNNLLALVLNDPVLALNPLPPSTTGLIPSSGLDIRIFGLGCT